MTARRAASGIDHGGQDGKVAQILAAEGGATGSRGGNHGPCLRCGRIRGTVRALRSTSAVNLTLQLRFNRAEASAGERPIVGSERPHPVTGGEAGPPPVEIVGTGLNLLGFVVDGEADVQIGGQVGEVGQR